MDRWFGNIGSCISHWAASNYCALAARSAVVKAELLDWQWRGSSSRAMKALSYSAPADAGGKAFNKGSYCCCALQLGWDHHAQRCAFGHVRLGIVLFVSTDSLVAA